MNILSRIIPEWRRSFGTVWRDLVKSVIVTKHFKKPFSPKPLLCPGSSGSPSRAAWADTALPLLGQLWSKQTASRSYGQRRLSYCFPRGMDVPVVPPLLSAILFGRGFISVVCASGHENASLRSGWGIISTEDMRPLTRQTQTPTCHIAAAVLTMGWSAAPCAHRSIPRWFC